MTAREYLSQLKKINSLIENKAAEVQQWRGIAFNVTKAGKTIKIKGEEHYLDRVQSTGNPQKMAEAVVRYTDLEEEIKQLKEKYNAIMRDLESLPALEYDILYKIYVQGYKISGAARRIKKSYRHTLRLRDKGLDTIQRIIDEKF